MEITKEDIVIANDAISLFKAGNKEKSILVLKSLINKYPNDAILNGLVGMYLVNLKKYQKALKYLETAYEKKPMSEKLTLNLYISYIGVENFKLAFKTLFHFLENKPAILLKDTLEELLVGLVNGYGTNYKDKIIFYSKKNNIVIPLELNL